MISSFVPPLLLLAIPFQLYAIYKLAGALQMDPAARVLWMLAMFVPIVALVCLLVLNSRATARLREARLEVGLMGARCEDLDRLEADCAQP